MGRFVPTQVQCSLALQRTKKGGDDSPASLSRCTHDNSSSILLEGDDQPFLLDGIWPHDSVTRADVGF